MIEPLQKAALAEPRDKVGRKLFCACAASLDAKPLVARVEEIGQIEGSADEFRGLILRCGSLIQQRPSKSNETKRNIFFADLRRAIEGASTESVERFDSAVRTMQRAEDGHHRILETRQRCAFVALPIEIRIAALLARAQVELDELQGSIRDRLVQEGSLALGGGLAIEREGAPPLSPEAIHSSLVRSLGGALKLEGYANRLFDADGALVLPDLDTPDGDAIQIIGSDFALGSFWLRWERFHETARYLDADIELRDGDNLPDGADSSIERIFTRQPEIDFVNFIANERSLGRENISGVRMILETPALAGAKGIETNARLWPEEWISAEEAGHAAALCESLGYDIAHDTDRPGGLRVVEWLRGYCALSLVAEERVAQISAMGKSELLGFLQRMSLEAEKAETLLLALTFGKQSRDLHDAPLLRTTTGFILVGAALANQRLAKIIPSALAAKRIVFERKGKAFEERTLSFLKKQGLNARAVKFTRQGEEYQYDVLAQWDDHIFLFECKNRGLSNNDPAGGYYAMCQAADDIEQVQRLVRGLAANPDFLESCFGPGANKLPIIPVVLHNDTFQMKGKLDGVYVYDWSALTRFFEQRHCHATRVHMVDRQPVYNRVPIKTLWAGQKPLPLDLVAQLEDPHQTAVMEAHCEVVPSDFPIDETTLVRDWSVLLHPMTEESMARVCGADPGWVTATLDRQGEEIDAGGATEPAFP